MSDEPARPGAITGTPSGIFEHYCEREGCTAWGGLGYARSKNSSVHWFCYEHRDDGELILGRSH